MPANPPSVTESEPMPEGIFAYRYPDYLENWWADEDCGTGETETGIAEYVRKDIAAAEREKDRTRIERLEKAANQCLQRVDDNGVGWWECFDDLRAALADGGKA